MIVSILFFDMNLGAALWTGLLAGFAYSVMVRLMYRCGGGVRGGRHLGGTPGLQAGDRCCTAEGPGPAATACARPRCVQPAAGTLRLPAAPLPAARLLTLPAAPAAPGPRRSHFYAMQRLAEQQAAARREAESEAAVGAPPMAAVV